MPSQYSSFSEPYLKVQDARSENIFTDYKPAYTKSQALTEAHRCLYCSDAPCIQACPTSINIPEFIRKIGSENTLNAAKTIFESNILGMSCARVCPVEVLCVGKCVYNEMEIAPIEIGKLQRYATDIALNSDRQFFTAGADTGQSIGLIGGGPASLTAAHALRRQGHHCTIYESREVLGGLNTWGVAPHKLKADDALKEISWLLGIGGIEIKNNTTVGKDISWQELQNKHDALFIGFGLGKDRVFNCQGHHLKGVVGAVKYIEQLKMHTVDINTVKNAVVIGGGNTAIDVVRELITLGIPRVTMVYRGTQTQMSGYKHEWLHAHQEGAQAIWNATPKSFEGNNSVKEITLQLLDNNKAPLEGETRSLLAELVVIATGQEKQGAKIPIANLALENEKVIVDDNGATNIPGIFAGGDCISGGKEVVNAVAEGNTAASGIHHYLENLQGGKK